jgi:hypothetical protein
MTQRWRAGGGVQPQQTHRVHRNCPVSCDPVQVRPSHPPGSTNTSDHLTHLDGVAGRDIGSAQMEVASHQASSVIEVHCTTREIEIRHQRDHPSSGRSHRIPDSAGIIGSHVPAGDLPIVLPRSTVPTGDPAGARRSKLPRPEPLGVVRTAGHSTTLFHLGIDSRLGGAVERHHRWRYPKPLPGKCGRLHGKRDVRGIRAAGALDDQTHRQRVLAFQRDPEQRRVPAGGSWLEVQWLPRGISPNQSHGAIGGRAWEHH